MAKEIKKKRLPSGLSLGLQIAALETEKTGGDNECVARKYRSAGNYSSDSDFLSGMVENLTMFRVQFTHFYTSSYNWKPSDEYNPKKLKK